MKKQRLGFMLMLLAALGFGFAVILMRMMTQSMSLPTYQIGIWRFVIAGPLIWLLNLLRKEKADLPRKRQFWLIGLGLVFAMSGYSALFALDRIPSSLYIIILYIYPSLIVIYSIIRNRPVPSLFWLGLPMSFIGLVITVYQPGQNLVIDLVGLLMTFLNAISMMVYILLSEEVFRGVNDRLSGTSWVITGAMLVSLSMIPIFGLNLPNSGVEWILLLTYGLFGTLMPVLSMNVGLQLIGAARGSVIITFQPVITVLLAILFLNEALSLQQWIGGMLVVTAVILMQLSPDRITSES